MYRGRFLCIEERPCKKEQKYIMDMYKDIELLYDSCRNADRINRDNLIKILRDNSGTDFGKKYGFADISGIEEYQKKVPITDYSFYDKLKEEPWKFTNYEVQSFLMTSGTLGRRKNFCLTTESLKRYGGYIYEMPYVLTNSFSGPHLHTSVFRMEKDKSTILSCAYYDYLEKERLLDCEQFVGGKELMFSNKTEDMVYIKAWLALGCAQLKSIQSIFLYDVLIVVQYILDNYKQLLADMRAGSIRADIDLKAKKKLLEYIPDSERMDEIEGILSDNDSGSIIRKLWKNIRFISGIGGEAYRVTTDALKKYAGDIPIYYFSYSSSECMMGAACKLNVSEYVLMPQCAFYEFLAKDGRVLTADKLCTGDEYELIITTFSGLYRYKMDDIVRFVGYEKEAPIVQVIKKKGNMVNIAGEKLDEGTLQMAVYEVGKKLEININNFSVSVNMDDLPAAYRFYLETKDKTGIDRNYSDRDYNDRDYNDRDYIDGISECFDDVLRALSADYDDIRKLGMLRKPEVVLLKSGSIAGVLMSADKHNKPKIILDSKQVKILDEKLEIGV